MTRWENMRIPLEFDAERKLDEMGDDGWELVSVVCAPVPGGYMGEIAYMKREKVPE